MVCSSRRLRVIAVVLVLALTLPTIALASLSTIYSVEGVETAATTDQGTFVGNGTGIGGDDAVWQAVVVHDQLLPSCYQNPAGCAITGGTFSLVNQDVQAVTGIFSSGSITLIQQAPGCGVQIFSVVGALTNVTTPTTTGGTGTFTVTLTHFRAPFFGRCTTFFAKVSGSVAFAF